MWLKISTALLLPVLVVQGFLVKKYTPKLPEPEGERHGQYGQGKAISILILGDSAAAGVGVSHQHDALSGALISELQKDYLITWKLHAKTGDDSSKIFKAISSLAQENFDVVITSIGVNDVTQLCSAKTWIKKQQAIYALIQEKFKPQLILASGVPPMHLFPALPNPLSWLMGQYAKQMNHQLRQFIVEHSNMHCIEYDIEKYQKMNIDMAEDGFHPSREVYVMWANTLAEKIRHSFKDNIKIE